MPVACPALPVAAYCAPCRAEKWLERHAVVTAGACKPPLQARLQASAGCAQPRGCEECRAGSTAVDVGTAIGKQLHHRPAAQGASTTSRSPAWQPIDSPSSGRGALGTQLPIGVVSAHTCLLAHWHWLAVHPVSLPAAHISFAPCTGVLMWLIGSLTLMLCKCCKLAAAPLWHAGRV